MLKKTLLILILLTLKLIPILQQNDNVIYAQMGEEEEDADGPYGEACILFPQLCASNEDEYIEENVEEVDNWLGDWLNEMLADLENSEGWDETQCNIWETEMTGIIDDWFDMTGGDPFEFQDANGDYDIMAWIDYWNAINNTNNNTPYDCAGVAYGTAYIDNCNTCVGGGTGLAPCAPPCTNTPFNTASITISQTATASIPLTPTIWGMTYPEEVEIQISACLDGGNWKTILTTLQGKYSQRVRLLPASSATGNVNVQEVTGPSGNTTELNYCAQVTCLKTTGETPNVQWYMLSAVQAHEDIHKTHFIPGLALAAPDIETSIEAFSVPNTGQTEAQAITQIKALPGYITQLSYLQQMWDFHLNPIVALDHAGGLSSPAAIAELNITNPMKIIICTHASTNNWTACSSPCN
jgi:hypothetical protein